MDKVFYCIADIFNGLFEILVKVGRPSNMIFIAIGFVGFFIWTTFGPKYKEPNK